MPGQGYRRRSIAKGSSSPPRIAGARGPAEAKRLDTCHWRQHKAVPIWHSPSPLPDGSRKKAEAAAMTVEDLAVQLGRTVLFNGLDQAELRRLAGIAREKTLPAGGVLFEQGDESDGL